MRIKQKLENKKLDDSKLAFLCDRMAILMVVCRLKYDIGWSVWLGEGLYTGETGDEFRAMPEFKVAIDVIRNMIRRHDNDHITVAADS